MTGFFSSFQIEVSGLLNLTRVYKSSHCIDQKGNSLEVFVPGQEMPMLLLCSRVERSNDYYKGTNMLKENQFKVQLYNQRFCFTKTIQECA